MLEIRSNVPIREREWIEIHELVQDIYRHHEAATGFPIEAGVLLHIIEVETVPRSYRFSASYTDGAWSHVTWAIVRHGQHVIHGPDSQLHEVLFDTLPHELGHTILAAMVPSVPADTRSTLFGAKTYHNRWFLDGVCEFLAKGFAKSQNGEAFGHYLRLRKPGTVLSRIDVRREVFRWEQHGSLTPELDSALYGAAYLLLELWTENVPLDQLLMQLAAKDRRLVSGDLIRMLGRAVGEDGEHGILERADQIGQRMAGDIESGNDRMKKEDRPH